MNQKSITDLLNESIEQDTHKADHVGPASLFKFNENSMLSMNENVPLFRNANVPPMEMTDWSYRQTFAKLGATVFPKQKGKSLPADYLLALPAEVRADLLNMHISKFKGRDWLVRSYDQTCRAILSDGYADTSNTELLKILEGVTSESRADHVLYNSSVNFDSLNVKIIWRNVEIPNADESNKYWGIGVYIGNGQIGNRKLRMTPYIQRHSCKNSLIIDGTKSTLEFTHRGSVTAKMSLVKANMLEILPVAGEYLNKMIEADYEHLPDFSDVLNGMTQHYGWSDSFAMKVATGTEGRETKAGIVNGITYAAQSIENHDERVDTEMLAGAILVSPDSVFSRMARIAKGE